MALSRQQGHERTTSAAAVVALHAALAWILIAGLQSQVTPGPSESLRTFIVPPDPPPPPPQALPPRATPRPERAAAPAAPENLKARPTPVVVPPRVRIPAPAPIRAAPTAESGRETSAGASVRPGPGTGAGGGGNGTGSGGTGTGTGSGRAGGDGAGRIVTRAALRSGRIVPRDYPRAANGAQGNVVARLVVSAQGAVTGCSVTRSSGNAVLDATTCRLIQERFRFAPARDAAGNAVPDVKGWQQNWWREAER